MPYFAINLGQIFLHDGGFIHFSKTEAVVFTTCLALALWLGSVVVLLASAAIARNGAWLQAFTAVMIFTGIATAIEPTFWTRFFDFLNDGLAEWVFRVGVFATLTRLAFKRKARLER